MSVESLPYTLLILLAQFTAGVAAIVLYTQVRGTFEPPFIRICAWMSCSSALLTMLLALFLTPVNNADAYALDADVFNPIRACSMALFLFSLIYVMCLRNQDEPFLAYATGATTVGLSVVLLVLLASLVRLPTWNVVGPLLTMFTGSLTLGVFTVAMIWGHWYLVKPSLEAGPLNELIRIALIAIVLETVVTALNAVVPVGIPVQSNALLAVSLPENPGFWLRIGIGLVFPGVLAFMAYKSSQGHAMESATGLLYIAVGAILAGEALARGLLFVTGAAV